MAASVWRMNGLWRRTAGVLVLCILLLSNMVTCQVTTDSTDQPATQSADPAAADPTTDVSAVTPPEAQGTTATLDVGDTATAGAGDKSAPFEDPGDASFQLTVQNVVDSDSQAGETSGTSGTTAAPVARVSMVPVVTEVPDDESLLLKMVPAVQCVGKEDIPESNAVRAVVETDNCEATKRIIQENPAIWCHSERCNLDVFQDGNKVMLTSKDVGVGSLAATLQSEHLKDKLGVTMTETPASSGSSVFFGILVSGLLAALGIIVGYCKCQRRPDPKGVRLAEEAYPVDPENQANTLVSVAPLNPPSETQEKPSVNGESPEAAKTQPTPPTNGHSTAKTADTEL